MNDAPAPLMSLYLGDYTVVERGLAGTVSLALGGNVYITIHVAGLPISVKPGDKLPLFTKIPYNPEPLDAILGRSSE